MTINPPFIGSTSSVPAPDVLKRAGPAGFVRLAFQQDPWRVLWAVRADGVLCGLTYRRDQDVWAWHRHPRSGAVRDIAVIPAPDGQSDDLWLLVERTVNGETRRYVEILTQPHEPTSPADSAGYVFLDSSLSYEGDPVSTLAGLDHLEGESIGVLADGVALSPRTVSGGQITLDAPASTVHAGLNFTALVDSLPLSRQAAEGTGEGRVRSVQEVRVLVRDSIGARGGRDQENTDALLDRTGADRFDRAPALITGYVRAQVDGLWSDDDHVVILQDQPYPLTIEAIVPVATRPGR